MVEQTAEDLVWTEARNKELLKRQRRVAGENIFAGRAIYDQRAIADLPVVRLSVAPEGEVVPQSFAVLEECQWNALPSKKLPMNITWQQSLPGTWDFSFPLSADARCMALGERFSGLDVRGAVHTLCTTDETKHTEFADSLYKAIPFLIVTEGSESYGIFLDSAAVQRWDLDAELDGTARIELFSRRGWQLYVIGPGKLSDVVNAYTQLTGRHSMPPMWSLGHQQCRWSYPDQKTVMDIAGEFRKRKIPCDTIVLDIDYMDEYRVFTASKERFPEFDTLAQKLDAQDFKIVTIVDPGVKRDPKYPLYKEAVAENLACKTPDGEDFTEEVWPGVCVFPDFEKSATRSWWGRWHEFYVKRGIAGIWNDMNEPAFFGLKRVLPEVLTEMPAYEDQPFTQETPEGTVGHLEVRNHYGMLMCRATHEGLNQLRPNTRAFVLTRSGYAGTQKYAAVWLGDNNSWWSHLRMSIPMIMNMGLSGIPFAGVDVGGFTGDCSAELLVRWYETGIFYPFFRNHCRMGDRPQEPWAYGEKVEKLIKRLIETRYRLLPYIYTLFWEHGQTGAPLMRPLSWHYPEDELAWECDDQFLMGRDILVAPIVEREKTRRTAYFPKGRWYPLEGGEPLEGGRVHLIKVPLGTVAAYVREGAILPLADVMQSTRNYATAPVTLTVYGAEARGTLIEDDGRSLEYGQGTYNELMFEYKNGALTSRYLHEGFAAPPRQFFLMAGSRRTPFLLRNSS